MEYNIQGLPIEILCDIFSNIGGDDIFNYYVTSNSSRTILNSKYFMDYLKCKYLPCLQYNDYNNDELLQLVAFNEMHALEFYLYTNVTNFGSVLANKFLNSKSYKMELINRYILPFMNEVNKNYDGEWLMAYDIDKIVYISCILYPIELIFDIMDMSKFIYEKSIQYTLFSFISTMFWRSRSDEDIVNFMERYLTEAIKYRLHNKSWKDIEKNINKNINNFLYFCIKFNRMDVLKYGICKLYKYLRGGICNNDFIHICNKFGKNIENMETVLEEMMNIHKESNYYEIYSGYIINSGIVPDFIKNIFSESKDLSIIKNFFYNSFNSSALYELIKNYIPAQLRDNDCIDKLIQKIRGSATSRLDSIESMQLIIYTLGPNYNKKIIKLIFGRINNEVLDTILYIDPKSVVKYSIGSGIINWDVLLKSKRSTYLLEKIKNICDDKFDLVDMIKDFIDDANQHNVLYYALSYKDNVLLSNVLQRFLYLHRYL